MISSLQGQMDHQLIIFVLLLMIGIWSISHVIRGDDHINNTPKTD